MFLVRFHFNLSSAIIYSQNLGNADAAYILAYATIMLATDLHNKSIANKITKEQVISPMVV
jgi:Sec7-like guanine-nucleotide exchange factor